MFIQGLKIRFKAKPLGHYHISSYCAITVHNPTYQKIKFVELLSSDNDQAVMLRLLPT